MKALLVEDTLMHIKKAYGLLASAGYEVTHCISAEEAEKYTDEVYDIYVIDNQLFGSKKGWEFAEEVKEKFPEAKIILHSMDRLYSKAEEIGVLFTSKNYALLENYIAEASGIAEPSQIEDWYMESALEVLHTMISPFNENFEKGFETLDGMLALSADKGKGMLAENISSAADKLKEMQKTYSPNTDFFDESYIASLAEVRDILLGKD